MLQSSSSNNNKKVSLRGASAKEITRDCLLEKNAQERLKRSQERREVSACLLIQRVWRGSYAACKAADVLRSEWDEVVSHENDLKHVSKDFLCSRIIRPFLFFALRHRFCLHRNIQGSNEDYDRIATCFKLLLLSINCSDSQYNFCSFSCGSVVEQSSWLNQVQKLLKLCCIVLVEMKPLQGLVVRLMVALTDVNLWKFTSPINKDGMANRAILRVIGWLGNGNTPLYPTIHTFLLENCPNPEEERKQQHGSFEKDKFVVVASVITMALRPFRVLTCGGDSDSELSCIASAKKAAQLYCVHVLTIPYLTKCIPSAVLPALQHPSVLNPCLEVLVESLEDILSTYPLEYALHGSNANFPPLLWALANVVQLVSDPLKKSMEAGLSDSGLNYSVYVKAVYCLLEKMNPWLESLQAKKKTSESLHADDIYDGQNSIEEAQSGRSITEQLNPLFENWYLRYLLDTLANANRGGSESINLSMPDVARLYSELLTLFSALNTVGGALPILNSLAFTKGMLVQLWEWLEDSLLLKSSFYTDQSLISKANALPMHDKHSLSKKDEGFSRSLTAKWTNTLSKITGKSSGLDISSTQNNMIHEHMSCGSTEGVSEKIPIWDIEALKRGPEGLAKEVVPVLALFCAVYGHLLLVLDDEEFYDRQVLFTLEQQRLIAASLNSLVYHGIFGSSKKKSMLLMKTATWCLRSLYARDCRRAFCHPDLWLAPAKANQLPAAATARAYEVAIVSMNSGDSTQAPAIGSALTTIPHVLPFDERVRIFRELVRADKAHRSMTGEVLGPGPGSIEISIRRDRIVEDGFAQLNPLRSKIKSGINVSFINEHGLQEAGLDYGGLFKEFLTDLAKAAFNPGYGLFAQLKTEEGLLFPNIAAASLGHGLQMIEFLGRIVGKALYEGILLDYSFSHVFLWKLLGRYSFLDELSSLDPDLYRNLMYLKRYEGDAKDLAIDFTVTEEILGKRITLELVANGAQIQVTDENKLHYVHAMADYKLNQQIRPLVNAFARGLSDLIRPTWLTLFNAREVNQLLSGGGHDYDVEDLRTHARYTGGFTENSRTVKLFWEVLKEVEPEERGALLKFVTSCSRAPLLGFKHLQPAFTIHKVPCDTPVWAMLGGQDVERLPSASTCYNTLKLPTYKRKSTLKTKLLYAIKSNAGFELS